MGKNGKWNGGFNPPPREGPPEGAVPMQFVQPTNDIQWIAQMAANMPPLMVQDPAEEGKDSPPPRHANMAERTDYAAQYLAQSFYLVKSGNFGIMLNQASAAAAHVVKDREAQLLKAQADADRAQAEIDEKEEQAKREFRARQDEEKRLKLAGETDRPSTAPKLLNESGNELTSDDAA